MAPKLDKSGSKEWYDLVRYMEDKNSRKKINHREANEKAVNLAFRYLKETSPQLKWELERGGKGNKSPRIVGLDLQRLPPMSR